MSTVTVWFVGICTHFWPDFNPALDGIHRVVLVNASAGADIRGVSIDPHTASIWMSSNDQQIDLHGCTLTLTTTNPHPPAVTRDASFDALPQLALLMETVEPIGAPASSVLFDRDPQRTAAHFDIGAGTLYACQDENDTAFAKLVLEGDAPFTLQLERWNGSTETFSLPDGTEVVVANADAQLDPTAPPAADFLLHYLTAAQMPTAPQVPQSIDVPACTVQFPMGTVGAGCSNSNYP